MAATEASDCPTSSSGCGVRDFYKDRSVFVTGATGFMGKVMVEKLLRTCDQIRRIYILVRANPNGDARKRWREMLRLTVFEKLLKDSPEVFDKVIPVAGDVTEPSLGLSEADEAMLVENVSVVFNLAATVRFEDPFKKTLRINLGGTKRLLDLCHKMPALKALVHVSTAYCHCQRQDIDEEFYPSFANPAKFLDVIESMDDGLVDKIAPLLMTGRPTVYHLSKALAEQLLVEEAGDLPVTVVRPSIVGGCWKEPCPGWTESFYGANGIVVAHAKGVLRCLIFDPKCSVDFVPVDAASNLTIAAAWYTAVHRPDKITIFNCTVNKENKMTYGENIENLLTFQKQQPVRPDWHPSAVIFQSFFWYRLYFYLTMLFPGILADRFAPFMGRPRIFVKMQKRILALSTSMGFFSTRDWNFGNANMWKLWETMSPQCKRDFFFDIREIHWPTYARIGHSGIKRFVAKEDPEGMEDDRRHAWRMRLVHYACQLTMALVLWRVSAFCCSLFF